MTRESETIPMQLRREGVKRSPDVTFGNFARVENFTDSVLGMDWMTLRGTAGNFYSLTDNPGFLTVKCADVTSSEKAVIPYIGRRIHHHNYTATTGVTFEPEHDKQCAGLLLMKDETHQYLLAKTRNENGHCVVLRKISENGVEDLASKAINDDSHNLKLKVDSKGLDLSFHYSADGGRTWTEVASGVDAGFTSTAKAGGFTGTTVGVYASNNI